MLPYKSMISIDPDIRMTIYVQIANGFIKEILSGKIANGLKLPGSRLIQKGFGHEIDLSAYSEGLYFISIFSEGERWAAKIIKL